MKSIFKSIQKSVNKLQGIEETQESNSEQKLLNSNEQVSEKNEPSRWERFLQQREEMLQDIEWEDVGEEEEKHQEIESIPQTSVLKPDPSKLQQSPTTPQITEEVKSENIIETTQTNPQHILNFPPIQKEEKHQEINSVIPDSSSLTPDSFHLTPNSSNLYSIPKPKEDKVDDLGVLYQLPPTYDVYVGDNQPSKQYGVLGVTAEGQQKIAMDLNGTNTISLFGVQGAGKSYSIGTVTEMVLKQFQNVNHLPNPLAGVIFHFSESEDYAPEFTSMIHPNSKSKETNILKEIYQVNPNQVKDIVLLVPKDKVEQRRLEYPNIPVVPIAFNSRELGIKEWKFLMGANNNSALYLKQFNNVLRSIRDDLSLSNLERAIQETKLLSASQKELAKVRLSLARDYINDDLDLKNLIVPGRLLLVDLRDEFIEKDDALSIFVIMLNIFANAKKEDGNPFNKFIVFDEAHKYMANKNLTDVIVETIREMRHKGVSLMIASQDPPSLPTEIIELSSMLIAHRFNSPQWLKHIQKSVTHLSNLSPAEMANLKQGEAFFWTNKSNNPLFTQQAVKIRTRPRVTQHGGGTLMAAK